MTGISYRQLDYWCRTGRLGLDNMNLGSGSVREFTYRDLQSLWWAARMIDAGFTTDVALSLGRDLAGPEGRATTPSGMTVTVGATA